MLKSLYSGISGMKGFQTKLDVIGNNIANVNTVGFKKDRVVFQDILSVNLTDATSPVGRRGGSNAQQVGLGSKIGSIDTVHTAGSPMTTNIGSDLAIDGDAYFVVSTESTGGENFLTKAGNFTIDGNGNLVNVNGFFVSGVAVQKSTIANTPDTTRQITINVSVDQTSNRDANGNVIKNGTLDTEPLKFTSYSIDGNGYINVVREDGKIGKLAMVMDPLNQNYGRYYVNDSDTLKLNENISIATSVVQNPGGLKKVGNTLFEESANSGIADFGRIVDNKGGKINSGLLEMSNVDLTEEFTEMIVAQRGFQANSRTITTSDSILEEVVNLKR